MKRAQINLWPPNFATGSVAWNDTGDQDFYDGSQLTVWRAKDAGCVPGRAKRHVQLPIASLTASRL